VSHRVTRQQYLEQSTSIAKYPQFQPTFIRARANQQSITYSTHLT